MEHYYHCPEESSAFIPRFDTANTRNDLSMVIDLDALRVQLNVTGALLLCIPRPQSLARNCMKYGSRILLAVHVTFVTVALLQ